MAKVQNYGRAMGKGGVSSKGGAYSNPQGATNIQFADFMAKKFSSNNG